MCQTANEGRAKELNGGELKLAADQAMGTARVQLEFICKAENLELLGKFRNGAKMIAAAQDFNRMIQSKRKLSPAQLSYIDGMYEKVMS